MKHSMSFCALVFAAALTLGAVTPIAAAYPIVPRSILKEYFQTGDRPTSEQFAILIDSSIAQFLFTAGAGGAHVMEGLEAGTGMMTDGSGLRQLSLGDTVGESPLFSQSVNLSSLIIDDRYLLGMRFMNNGLPHFGYMDVSVDSPLPGHDGYYGLTIYGWAYDDAPNTPITVAPIPAPGALCGGVVFALLAGTRRRR